RGEYGRLVVGDQRAQVDDLHLDAVFFQQLGGFEAGPGGGAVADEREVAALARDAGGAERGERLARRQRLLDAPVEELVLAEDHRVGVADGGLHQRPRVTRRRRADDLQAAGVGEPALGVLRVERPGADPAARRQPHYQRAGNTEAVVELRGDVDELVEGVGDEVGKLHFDHRAIAEQR